MVRVLQKFCNLFQKAIRVFIQLFKYLGHIFRLKRLNLKETPLQLLNTSKGLVSDTIERIEAPI